MKMKTLTTACFLLITLGFAAYLDSPFSFINIKYSYTADQPVIAEPASIKPEEDKPEIVRRLIKTEKIDGYIVETYQEFEVIKEGNKTKEIPTSVTETLTYWDYRGKDR